MPETQETVQLSEFQNQDFGVTMHNSLIFIASSAISIFLLNAEVRLDIKPDTLLAVPLIYFVGKVIAEREMIIPRDPEIRGWELLRQTCRNFIYAIRPQEAWATIGYLAPYVYFQVSLAVGTNPYLPEAILPENITPQTLPSPTPSIPSANPLQIV